MIVFRLVLFVALSSCDLFAYIVKDSTEECFPQVLIISPLCFSNIMASSSSETDGDPTSSPPIGPHYATDYESDNQHDSQESRSPPSSPPRKRRRYKMYLEDPSVEIPRETQRRWNLAGTNASLASSSATTVDAGPKEQSTFEHLEELEGSSEEDEAHSDNNSDSDSDSGSTTNCDSTSDNEVEVRRAYDSEDSSDCNASISSRDSPAPMSQDVDSVSSSEDSDIEPLFKGSTKSTDEAVSDICSLFLKHRWSKSSLGDTLKLMASTLPDPNNMPHSLATLKDYLNVNALPCSRKPHFYCATCLMLKASQPAVCQNCQSILSGVFYSFSVADEIKFLFENHNLSRAIDNYRNVRNRRTDQQKDSLCDILDGSEYVRVKSHAKGMYDITLAWNTDGVSISKSSDVKLYPVLSTICEVAPELRSRYLMVNSIWVDASAPKMSVFLKAFAEELNDIYEAGGVEWKHPETGQLCKSQVIAPLFIGDAPVRGDVLEVMRYNSIRGCEACEQKAVKLPPRDSKSRSVRRFVFTETPATLRTRERMHLQGEYAESNGKKHVKGVKKQKSIVDDFPLLDRAGCTLAEYMHSVLLGVTLHFALLWTSKHGPWYLGNSKNTIDEFLSSVKVLDFMRDARKISKVSRFKASELRSWLLLYSLPALQEADFPEAYFQHWILFVKSIHLLLQDEISESDLKSAEIMLRCFVRDIGKLYSNYDYVYNVHQLSHLTTYVSRWGPLPKTSAFVFENYNGVLSRMLHGTKHQAVEISESLKLARGIHILNQKVKSRAVDGDTSISVASVLGKAGRITLTPDDVRIFTSEGITDFEIFRRASFRRLVYTSHDYDINKKKCNSLIEFYDANGAKCRGEIVCFVRTMNATVLCYVEKFKIVHSNLIFNRDTMQKFLHLLPVAQSNERVLVKFSSIICKVMKVGKFIGYSPNEFEKRL